MEPGSTTPDGRVSLLKARCLGPCSMAPAVVIDGEVHGHALQAELVGVLEKL